MIMVPGGIPTKPGVFAKVGDDGVEIHRRSCGQGDGLTLAAGCAWGIVLGGRERWSLLFSRFVLGTE